MTIQDIIDQCEVQGAVQITCGDKILYESGYGINCDKAGGLLDREVTYISTQGSRKDGTAWPGGVVFEVE